MNNTFETSKKLFSIGKASIEYMATSEPRIEIIKNWIGSKRKVLDLACYDGSYSLIFKELGNVVYGIDSVTEAVKEAKKKGIKAYEGDLEKKLPFKNNFFDVAHGGEIIEHLYDTDTFVSECHRVLKKDGLLIITTPNVVSLPRRILYLLGQGRFFEASNTFSSEGFSVGHIRFFTKKLLKDFVESHGFVMEKFTSDYVNLPIVGRSFLLAKIIPTFGRTIIMSFRKK